MKKTLFNLFVIFFISVFCSLGTWQLYRLQWKLDLIEQINFGLKTDPVQYSKKINNDYQRVMVEGKFKFEKQIYLYSLNENGKPGFDVITPFLSSKNEYLLVNRGWIDKQDKNKKNIDSFEEKKITGIIKKIQKANIFKPENDLSENIWFSINLDDLKKFTGISFDDHVIFLQGKDYNLPKTKIISADLTNNHLKYALTWYAVALSILIYFLYFKRRQ